ncbi:MAG: hypothetical protein HZA48_00875 [Planctomycetes bacterium]|nr:hypothetical protein [Planctomycetota bacterium]
MEETPSKNNPDANLNELLGKGISLDQSALEKYGAIADKAVKDILQKTRPDGAASPSHIRDNMSEIISKTISEMGSEPAIPDQPARNLPPFKEELAKEEPVVEAVQPVPTEIPAAQVEERVEPVQQPEPVRQSEPVLQSGPVSSHVEKNRVVLDVSDEQINNILADALKEHDKVADELTVRNLVEQTPFQRQAPVDEIISDQPEPGISSPENEAADISHHDVLNELSRTIEETVVPEEPIQQDMIDALVREAGMGNAGSSPAVDAPSGQGTLNIEEDLINQILQSQPELAQSGDISKEPDIPIQEELPESPAYTEEPAIAEEPEIAAVTPAQKEASAKDEGYKQQELPSSFVISTALRVLWQGFVKFISGLADNVVSIIAFPFKEAYLVLEHFKEILPVITVLIGIFWLVLGLISPSSVVPFVLSVVFLLPNIVHAYNSHTSK